MYEELEASNAEFVGLYVKTVGEVLGDETREPPAVNLLAELKDPATRQMQMRELVRNGQAKISKASMITSRVGDMAGITLSVKGIVDPVL